MPNLFSAVKKSATKVRTVREVMSGKWWRDVSPNMDAQGIQEFLRLVDRVRFVKLAEGIDDKIVWTWEDNGLFSARTAYRAHFAARIEAAGATEIWKSRAPTTCKFFSWLAAKRR